MSDDYKFGIEEEYFLVDAETKSVSREMPKSFLEQVSSATGGQLDVDVQCSGNGGLENIVWGSGSTPSAGTYRVRVDEFAQCGQGAAAWTVEAYVGNRRVLVRSGSGDVSGMTFEVPL